MALDWTVIGGPLEVHGVRTAAEYARKQRAYLNALRQRGIDVVEWDADAGALVLISGGKYVVRCGCGNAPAAQPEWDEARCFECGGVFRNLTWPADATEIAAVLLQRPQRDRHYRPDEGATLDVLIAENVARGLSGI